MRKKVQSPGRQTQPGTSSAVGKLPIAQTASECLPTGIDPTQTSGRLETPAGHPGTGGIAVSGESTSSGNRSIATRILMGVIRIYQLTVSPWLPPCCRFTPSCSHYAMEALAVHGAWKGTWLTMLRLLRCQPFCRGGYDPVPPRSSSDGHSHQ